MACSTEPATTTNKEIHGDFIDPTSHEIISQYSSLLVQRPDWYSVYTDMHHKMALKTPVTSIYVSESQSGNCYNYQLCINLLLTSLTGYANKNFIMTGDGSIFESS